MTTPKIVKGTRFFAQWTDCSVEWEVQTARGSSCRCVIVSEDGQGTLRSFAKDEIARILGWAAYVQKTQDESDEFFAALQEGQIVHYNNGGNEFVRCRVVRHEGRNQLLKIALVGDWEFHSDYHRKGIQNGDIWTPHATCVYEYEKCAYKHRMVDPTHLPILA